MPQYRPTATKGCKELFDLGAWMLPLRGSSDGNVPKAPAVSKHGLRHPRPFLTQCLDTDLVGFYPGSVTKPYFDDTMRLLWIDYDGANGDTTKSKDHYEEVCRALGSPLVVMQTSQRGRWAAVYWAVLPEDTPQSKWKYGDMRYCLGYVALHGNMPQMLVTAINKPIKMAPITVPQYDHFLSTMGIRERAPRSRKDGGHEGFTPDADRNEVPQVLTPGGMAVLMGALQMLAEGTAPRGDRANTAVHTAAGCGPAAVVRPLVEAAMDSKWGVDTSDRALAQSLLDGDDPASPWSRGIQAGGLDTAKDRSHQWAEGDTPFTASGAEMITRLYTRMMRLLEEGVCTGALGPGAMRKAMGVLDQHAGTKQWTRDLVIQVASQISEMQESLSPSGAKMASAVEIVSTGWNEPVEERHWLVPGWVPLGRAGILTGVGGQGKTALATQLAVRLLIGDDHWMVGGPRLDHTTMGHGRVALVSWEDEPVEIRRRIHALYRDSNTDISVLDNRLVMMDCSGHGPLWAPRTTTRSGPTPLALRVRKAIEDNETRLVIIDPLAAANMANENDRGQVREFMAWWDNLAREAQCTVLFIAHPSKSSTGEGAGLYSGSTDWFAASRFAMWLGVHETGTGAAENARGRRPPAPGLCLRSPKQSYAMLPGDFWLRRSANAGPYLAVSPEASAAALAG